MNDQTIAARIDRLPISPMHRRLLFVLAIPLFFDVGDIFTFSNAAPALIKYWGLTNDQIALATASGFLGMAIGGTLGGILADRIGRIRAMMLFVATFSIFSLANGFVSSVPMLVALLLLLRRMPPYWRLRMSPLFAKVRSLLNAP